MSARRRHLARLAVLVTALALPASALATPHAQINSGPDASSVSTTAQFEFSATADTLFAKFNCRIDGAEWTACMSPARYENLADQAHTFEVRLTGIGADSSPAMRQWTIATPQ